MAKILLDSDVIIEWLRGHQPFTEQIPRLIEEHSELFWSPVSVAEIFTGVRKSEESRAANLFLLLEPVMISMDTGRRAGEYLKSYSKSHGVELGDALIAASASLEGLRLWTLNRKHYPMRGIDFYKYQPDKT
jgi:predicted nucleic acid-binding protein